MTDFRRKRIPMLLGFKAQQIPYIIIIRADRDKIDRINVKIYIVKSMKTN